MLHSNTLKIVSEEDFELKKPANISVLKYITLTFDSVFYFIRRNLWDFISGT